MLHKSLRATGILLLVLTAGCGSYLPSFYNVPVRQGNYLDSEMVGHLHPGMTKTQVQRILGTPLITDPTSRPSTATQTLSNRPRSRSAQPIPARP